MPDDTVLLERHFDTAFAAPDGIQKLRELILTLAMQGKLVPQDPKDQPAGELLKEIEAEKQRLVKDGKIKQLQPLPEINPQDMDYQLPNSWEWVRLGEVTNYNGRININSEEIEPETWLLDLEDIEKDTSRVLYRAKYSERQSKSTKSTFKKGDVLYGKLRPYLNKVVVADADGICTTEIVPIVPIGGIDSEFLRWLLKRPSFLDHVNTLMYGVKMPRLGTGDAIMSVHPLPPLAEQRHIVAKIDRLMARCDELEKLRAERNQKRITIHTAALDRLLNAKESDNFSTAWHFITQHFGELYSVKKNVAELRKAILQLAVMGKLVPQDPTDEPASELLRAIAAEKQQLVKEGKIKQPKPLPDIKPEEVYCELPYGWEFVRFGELSTEIATGPFGSMIHKSDYVEDGAPLINPVHMVNGEIIHDPTVTVNLTKAEELSSYELSEGDIVMARRGELGRCAIVSKRSNGWLCGTGSFVLRFIPAINRSYILILFKSQAVRDYLGGNSVGTTMTNLNHGILNMMPLMLPPISEQRRIVAKIDQLMALCNHLDQQIDAATSKQADLLNAVMAQV